MLLRSSSTDPLLEVCFTLQLVSWNEFMFKPVGGSIVSLVHHIVSSLCALWPKQCLLLWLLAWSDCVLRDSALKGIVHPKMTILSLFTLALLFWTSMHFYSVWNSTDDIIYRKYVLRWFGPPWRSLYRWKQIFFCVLQEQESFRFRMTWGWVDDESVFILGELFL